MFNRFCDQVPVLKADAEALALSPLPLTADTLKAGLGLLGIAVGADEQIGAPVAAGHRGRLPAVPTTVQR